MSSADVSAKPAWKQALIDRKRRQEEQEGKGEVDPTAGTTGMTIGTKQPITENPTTPGSTWKPTTLSKNHKKYAAPSIPVPLSACDTDRKDAVIGRVEPIGNVAIRTELSPVDIPEIKVSSTGSVSAANGDSTEEPFVEERLLPIKQNPILLSDREKRKRFKPNHLMQKKSDSKAKLSPRNSMLDDASASGSQSPQEILSPAAEDASDEVFEEVTYGKGFVHKLLQKFNFWSGKDDQAPAASQKVTAQGHVRNSGDSPKSSQASKSTSRHSGSEREAAKNKSTRPTVNSYVDVSEDGTTFQNPEIIQNGDCRSEIEADHVRLDAENGLHSNQIYADADKHSQSNIVSAARGIFENLNSSPVVVKKKPPASGKPNLDRPAQERTPLERPIPEKPTSDKQFPKRPAPEPNATEKLSTTNANSGHVWARSVATEPDFKTGQAASVNKTLHVAVDTKKQEKQEPEITKSRLQPETVHSKLVSSADVNENFRNEREHLEGHSVLSSNAANAVRNLPPVSRKSDIGVSQSIDEKVTKPADSNVTASIGILGSKSTVKAYGDSHTKDEKVSSKFSGSNIFEQKGAKNTSKPTSSRTSTVAAAKETKAGQLNSMSDSSQREVTVTKKETSSIPTGSHSNGISDAGMNSVGEKIKELNHSASSITEQGSADVVHSTRVKAGHHYPSSAETHRQKPGGDSLDSGSSFGIQTEKMVTVIQIGSDAPVSGRVPMQPVSQNEHQKNKTVENSWSYNKNNAGPRTDTGVEGVRNDIKSKIIRNDKINNGYDDTNIRRDGDRSDRDQKSTSKPVNVDRTSLETKANASRPGKLLIRPASNLFGANTKTEFLGMTKFKDIKTGEFAPAKRPAVVEDVNGDIGFSGADMEEPLVDGGQFVFFGAGVSVGKSMLAKTRRGKKLNINFNDLATLTHEYPSEQSLMEAIPAQPGDVDYPDGNIRSDNGQDSEDEQSTELRTSGLSSSPAITAAEALSDYKSRMQVDYDLGMYRSDDVGQTSSEHSPPEPKSNVDVGADSLAQPSKDLPWSETASSDLLF